MQAPGIFTHACPHLAASACLISLVAACTSPSSSWHMPCISSTALLPLAGADTAAPREDDKAEADERPEDGCCCLWARSLSTAAAILMYVGWRWR